MNSFKKVTELPGVWIRSLLPHIDNRGVLIEEFKLKEIEIKVPAFVQYSLSYSGQNVLRGMHSQRDQWQLVTLIKGSIIDVVINIDENSEFYLNRVSFNLTPSGVNQILISPGIAHGFAVTSNEAIIHYKSSVYYDIKKQSGIRWDSKPIVEYWPKKDWIISSRDASHVKIQ